LITCVFVRTSQAGCAVLAAAAAAAAAAELEAALSKNGRAVSVPFWPAHWEKEMGGVVEGVTTCSKTTGYNPTGQHLCQFPVGMGRGAGAQCQRALVPGMAAMRKGAVPRRPAAGGSGQCPAAASKVAPAPAELSQRAPSGESLWVEVKHVLTRGVELQPVLGLKQNRGARPMKVVTLNHPAKGKLRPCAGLSPTACNSGLSFWEMLEDSHKLLKSGDAATVDMVSGKHTVWRASVTPFLWAVLLPTVAVGIIKAVDRKAAGAGKVTRDSQKTDVSGAGRVLLATRGLGRPWTLAKVHSKVTSSGLFQGSKFRFESQNGHMS
ncbi:Elongation factor 1-alpha 1, partial [Galemys pyrenaicus]